MYFYITLYCIGYSPSIPLSRHQGPTIPYYPPLLGPIPLLRVPSSSYSLSLTASLYDPVPGSNRWNPCTHVHPCQVVGEGFLGVLVVEVAELDVVAVLRRSLRRRLVVGRRRPPVGVYCPQSNNI